METEQMVRALSDVELLKEMDRSHGPDVREALETEAINRGFIKPADMEDE